jgi:hypothetical protein
MIIALLIVLLVDNPIIALMSYCDSYMTCYEDAFVI